METIKQCSRQQACYIIVKGGPVPGRQKEATLCGAGPPSPWPGPQVRLRDSVGSPGLLLSPPPARKLVLSWCFSVCVAFVSPTLSASGRPPLAVWVLARLILGSL